MLVPRQLVAALGEQLDEPLAGQEVVVARGLGVLVEDDDRAPRLEVLPEALEEGDGTAPASPTTIPGRIPTASITRSG
jgi:hypothetical protein